MFIKINLYSKLKESDYNIEDEYTEDAEFDDLINDVMIIPPEESGGKFIKKTVIVDVDEIKKSIHIKKERLFNEIKIYKILNQELEKDNYIINNFTNISENNSDDKDDKDQIKFIYLNLTLDNYGIDMCNYINEISSGNQSLIDIPNFIDIINQMYNCMNFIHNAGYVHCDIKLQNFLIDSNIVKIIDFECCRKIDSTNPLNCQTFFYTPPEYFADPTIINKEFDYWSLGVCILQLLIIYKPFNAIINELNKIFKENIQGDNSTYILDILEKVNQIGKEETNNEYIPIINIINDLLNQRRFMILDQSDNKKYII